MTNQRVIGLNYTQRLELAARSRHDALRKCFGSPLASLTSLMGPMSEGPDWPSGASWLATRHGSNACVVSDGLSDPWVERTQPDIGLGLEVFVESPDVALPEQSALSALADTWLFPMIAEVSHTLAKYPRLCNKLVNGEPLSLQFNIEHIKDGRGLVGAMLHQPRGMQAQLALNGGTAQLIAATLLTAQELAYLRGKHDQGRRQLLERLYAEGIGYRSLVDRSSLC